MKIYIVNKKNHVIKKYLLNNKIYVIDVVTKVVFFLIVMHKNGKYLN